MNCAHWQRKILRAQSGELPDAERAALDGHVTACPECQSFMAASEAVTSLTRSTLRHDEDPGVNLAPIRCEADRLASSRAPLRFARPSYVQITAFAAALILVAGGWLMLSPNRTKADPIHDVGILMSMVSDAHDGVVSLPAQGDDATRLQALAQEILRMEGLSADDIL